MQVTTLVMAGGQGERVRQSVGPIAKPLLLVRGVPLLERNLTVLLRQGLRDFVVSVPSSIPEIKQFVIGRGRDLIEAVAGTLEILDEATPRGNIGCAADLRGKATTVLVVFADNLTTLNLRLFLSAHQRGGASATMATHLETVRSSYGEIVADEGRIVAYHEKPSRSVLISSGICALEDRALAAISRDRPTGMSVLVRDLIRKGDPVAEYRHSAPWVDVNDAEALRRAELLVTEYWEEFECEGSWPPAS